MTLEKKYYKTVSKEKVGKLGQYFTPKYIADFMRNWIMESKPKSILDPAVGNGVFLNGINCEQIRCYGYEIDREIIEFFKKEYQINYQVLIEDYLRNEWDLKFDAIICNPPYNRFQMIDGRKAIIENFNNRLGLKISGYTNQYILFLLKSIYQLNDNGRLAYIIPNEFLNCGYGYKVKKYLIENKLLYAIINFDSKLNIFENVMTTACIVLVKKEKLDEVEFINISSINEFEEISINFFSSKINRKKMKYSDLNCREKWCKYFNNGKQIKYKNLVKFSIFAKAMRGIATGDNKYFVFNESKRLKFQLDERSLMPCITRSNDIKGCIFSIDDFNELRFKDKNVYVFDGTLFRDENNENYIKLGTELGVHKKYLTRHRNPWYRMESKEAAPILVNVFSRNSLKVVRNLAQIKNLTCFHGIFMQKEYVEFTNILFCYLSTPIGQNILYLNKRQYGGGLDKFEPNDINDAMCLDFHLLTTEDRNLINQIYSDIINIGINDSIIDTLNSIFARYVC